MRIGEKIRSLRKNKNITQTQLAEVLSVSAQSVSKWENHISVPDISVLPVINHKANKSLPVGQGVQTVAEEIIHSDAEIAGDNGKH